MEDLKDTIKLSDEKKALQQNIHAIRLQKTIGPLAVQAAAMSLQLGEQREALGISQLPAVPPVPAPPSPDPEQR